MSQAHTPDMAITLRVRELREALRLNQGQLAEKAGITRATVNRLENAKVSSIDLGVLEKLANALGVNAAAIILHTAEPPKAKRRGK